MNRARTIITATNFSGKADNAVLYAAGIAKANQAKLVLYNVFSLNVTSCNSFFSADGLQIDLERPVVRLADQCSRTAELFNIEVGTVSSLSLIEDELLSIVRNEAAGLLVAGMPSCWCKQFIGSNLAMYEILKINIPVLYIPKNAQFGSNRKIFYICDGISLSFTKRSRLLRQIIGESIFEIKILNIGQRINGIKGKRPQSINDTFKKDACYYKGISIEALIKEVKKEIEYNHSCILVMDVQKSGLWDCRVQKQEIIKMLSDLKIPLLLLP